MQCEVHSHHIIIMRTSGSEQYIPTHSCLWEPLSYSLLFPYGTLGWGKQGSLADILETTYEQGFTNGFDRTSSQMWHYHSYPLHNNQFQVFGCLTNEYIVNMFSQNLKLCLYYICQNQERLRQEDAELMGVDNIMPNENIYLLASFLELLCWASEQIVDSLAVTTSLGSPIFFITVTCNANWPKIQSQLLPRQSFLDQPMVVCRVFKWKLVLLIKTLRTMFVNAGNLVYLASSIEFQKWGLPHAHILVKYCADYVDHWHIDDIVSVEMPEDPIDWQLVETFMLHHHILDGNQISKYCVQEDCAGWHWCHFNYPKPL